MSSFDCCFTWMIGNDSVPLANTDFDTLMLCSLPSLVLLRDIFIWSVLSVSELEMTFSLYRSVRFSELSPELVISLWLSLTFGTTQFVLQTFCSETSLLTTMSLNRLYLIFLIKLLQERVVGMRGFRTLSKSNSCNSYNTLIFYKFYIKHVPYIQFVTFIIVMFNILIPICFISQVIFFNTLYIFLILKLFLSNSCFLKN